MRKIFSIFSVLAFCLGLVTYSTPLKARAEDIAPTNLVISEVQTGACSAYDELNPDKCIDEDGKAEFVELYNPLNQDIDLTDWQVDYISSSGKTLTPLFTFDGNVGADSYIMLAHEDYYKELADGIFGMGDLKSSGMLAKSGGHLEIKDDSGDVIDMVGWGDALLIDDWSITSEIPPSYSVKRILPGSELYGMGLIFTAPTRPVEPQYGGYIANQAVDDGQDNNDNNDQEDTGQSDSGGMGGGPQTSCEGIIFSELLPNPSGSDTGHEFIELYNPTADIIDLAGCKLQTSANSKMYEFTSSQMQSGQYKAFYNDKTGLTLSNSGGGSVYLIDTDGNEINQVDYPSALDDDVSWSLIDEGWTKTFSATPNKANELLESQPCPTGQIRNPDTNRCINIVEEAAGLSPCPAGKERNLATNRCRNLASLASTLKACAANQVRNPLTNRCKKAAGSASSLAPCKPGQERNPQTHRCRKASAGSSSSTLSDVKDVLSDSTKNTANWAAAVFAVFGAFSYAVFEWRSEIIQQIGTLRSKFS